MKAITGDRRIKARRCFEDFWEFEATHTLWLATNHQPKITGNDTGIWRRIKLIPFNVDLADVVKVDPAFPEKLKGEYPAHKIVITFFSPSGYEVKKNTAVADAVCYLPMDTQGNAKRFLETIQPDLAIFVKYEVWPNYLKALENKKIPALLVSAIFKKEQIYFKSYGRFMRKALGRFSYYFVQDEHSKVLLESIKIKNVSISGDTRLDRVSEILDRDNSLDFMKVFKKDTGKLLAMALFGFSILMIIMSILI